MMVSRIKEDGGAGIKQQRHTHRVMAHSFAMGRVVGAWGMNSIQNTCFLRVRVDGIWGRRGGEDRTDQEDASYARVSRRPR